jgi:uncharacterized phage protein (TIGR01671 family)
MRELKLHAFYDGKMYDVKAICFEGRKTVTLQYNPIIKVPLDYVKLRQYTGLKDKNGKEIFEGDILVPSVYKKATGLTWIKFRSEVVFSNGMFHLKGPRVAGVYPLSKFIQSGITAKNEYEIIGNIYENPELMHDTDPI